jgi:hypothetical protein
MNAKRTKVWVDPNFCRINSERTAAMNKAVAAMTALAVALLQEGCYSLPKQTGTWEGKIESLILYDAEKQPCTSAALIVTGGPPLKGLMPTKLALVNKYLKTYPSEEILGNQMSVSGQILSGFPICSSTGKMLVGYRPEAEHDFPIYFLKVRKIVPAKGGSNTSPKNL